jgi:hypothetical protein
MEALVAPSEGIKDMKLVLRRNDATNDYPVLGEADDFSEPFIPNVGDVVFLADVGNLTVASRRFSFAAGAPNVEGVELYLG